MYAKRSKATRTRPAPWTNRLPVVGLVCAVALLLGIALAGADSLRRLDKPVAADKGADLATPPPTTARDRTREGTQIVDQLGHFRMTGDRVAFFATDGQHRMVALENLNLERITRTVADDPDRLTWCVSGMVTEFRGANFLLIDRATIKDRTPRGDEASTL